MTTAKNPIGPAKTGKAKPQAAKVAPAKRVPGATREAALKLLRREQGATMSELTKATGWLPHSARAVISTLRKQGLTVTRGKRAGATCYKIEEQG